MLLSSIVLLHRMLRNSQVELSLPLSRLHFIPSCTHSAQIAIMQCDKLSATLSVLVVSQFTLYGDCEKGRRSW